MDLFLDSFWSALYLIADLDADLLFIVYVTLKISLVSTLAAGLVGVPIGFLIAFQDFKGKRLTITVFNTLLAVPTVVIGLFVYVFISRRGIFGTFDLLYTQQAIIIGQIMLVTPIVVTYTMTAVSRIDERYRKTAQTLGASELETALVILKEARFGIVAAGAASFGRVIAEVGISMMLGGNIKGFTRTMTTAIALEYDKGEFILAVALGLVLMVISFCLNFVLGYVQGKGRN